MTNGEDRLDRIEQLVEANAQQILRTQQQVELNSSTLAELIRLSIQSREEFEAFRTTTQQTLNSVNAAVERIDRVMDYLMRRDGDRPAE